MIASNKELPNHIQQYDERVQSQWRHVFNTVRESTNDSQRAIMAANSVLKKRFTGAKSMENNSRKDHMNCLVDQFLNNLEG